MFEVVIGVLVIEVGKVANEAAKMEVDKEADTYWRLEWRYSGDW